MAPSSRLTSHQKGTGSLRFSYVFGSEEYPQYAPFMGIKVLFVEALRYSAAHNDVFGVFVWTRSAHTNFATVPGTSTPVTVETVNMVTNDAYYVQNHYDTLVSVLGVLSLSASGHPWLPVAVDGLTTVLTTRQVNVVAGTTYHFKIGIADGATSTFDSNVWLKANSFAFVGTPKVNCEGSWGPWGSCSATYHSRSHLRIQ